MAFKLLAVTHNMNYVPYWPTVNIHTYMPQTNISKNKHPYPYEVPMYPIFYLLTSIMF